MKSFRLTFLVPFFALLFIFPSESLAATSNFVLIDSLDSKSTLQEDGSLDVEERIRYRAVGDIAYIRHYIDMKGRAELPYDSISVEEVRQGEVISYKEDYSNLEGQEGVYALGVGNEDVQSIDLFIANAEEEDYEFILRYTVENVGAIYYDSGRLNRSFIAQEIAYPIHQWSIQLTFAQPDIATLYYFSAGSEEYGKVAATEEGFLIQGGEILDQEPVDVDVFFPQQMIKDSLTYIPEAAQDIQKARDEQIQSLTTEPEWLGLWTVLSWIVAIGLALISFFFVAQAIREKRRAKRISFHSQPPALIQATIDRVLSQRGLNATLLDFIRRGMLNLSQDQETYRFHLRGLANDVRTYEASFYDHLNELSQEGRLSTRDLIREAAENSEANNAWIKALNKEIHDERKTIRLGANLNSYKPVVVAASLAIILMWLVFFFANNWLTLVATLVATIFFVVILVVSLSPSPGTNEFYEEAEAERQALLSGKGRGSFLKRWVNALVVRIKNEEAKSLLDEEKKSEENNFIRYLFSKEAERLWFKEDLTKLTYRTDKTKENKEE